MVLNVSGMILTAVGIVFANLNAANAEPRGSEPERQCIDVSPADDEWCYDHEESYLFHNRCSYDVFVHLG